MKTFSALTLLLAAMFACSTAAFSVVSPSTGSSSSRASLVSSPFSPLTTGSAPFARSTTGSSTQLYMAEKEKARSNKKGLQTIVKERVQEEQKDKKEPNYRVLLHNDEVHTFQYVVRALTKVIGTLDRKAAFELCVETHGRGKAVITKTWKKQAMQFCMGLQRQGLTVSITPDEDFDGGHYGGGNV
jgi:ATP-dependent Clp protease adapter protein ClpS